MKFIFFGSSRLSVIVLDELERLELTPAAIVTTPDKPRGRKLAMTPNEVKTWATAHKIRVYSPARLDASFAEELAREQAEVFIVASYGKIIPERLLDLPPRKVLNIHPSLLPAYRGPSPLPTAMLDDAKKTGVTIMRLDKEMDHGPIVAQKEVVIKEWPTYEEFEEMMAREGAHLLASVLPDWISERCAEHDQDHSQATYTKKIAKDDAAIDLAGDPYENFRKIQAYHAWPQAHFFTERRGRKLRIKITSASYKDGRLIIEKVIPEGAREMPYEDFKKGYGSYC